VYPTNAAAVAALDSVGAAAWCGYVDELLERTGEARPWGMQHLLACAPWDTDAVTGELRVKR
jgi:hypothetical protein